MAVRSRQVGERRAACLPDAGLPDQAQLPVHPRMVGARYRGVRYDAGESAGDLTAKDQADPDAGAADLASAPRDSDLCWLEQRSAELQSHAVYAGAHGKSRVRSE